MFKLKRNPTFVWPVAVKIPIDGGQFVTEIFDGTFKRLTHSRLEEVRKQVETGSMTDVTFAREVLVGWGGVWSGDDPVPFGESARDELLEVPGAPAAVVRAYLDAVAGLARGN